ncbi:MAG: hypothetical protein OEY48_04435, partial [Gammaproteobacteria bacterium]|nr:hypothetical protein [Gammaproteobacteria bacterium]
MLQLIGRSAFSAFRLDKLLTSIQSNVDQVLAIRSEYRYFIELDGESELNTTEKSVVETLLEAQEKSSE